MSLLQSKVGKLSFSSPLMAASGTWGYGLEFLEHPIQKYLGAFVTKSLGLNASEGALPPRFYETDAGFLNSIGLQNIGIDSFIQTIEPKLKTQKTRYVLSIFGERLEDFRQLAEKSNSTTAIALEINISCPNIDKGGLEFSSDPIWVTDIVKQVKKVSTKPVWVKLSPNVTDISEIAVAAESAGVDAISMINTVMGMSINIESGKPWLGRMRGGLSGPAIRPIAIEKVFRCAERVKIPIIGMGGIRNARDVLEFLMAGASAVQIGSWNFRDPFAYQKIAQDLETYLKAHGLKSIIEVVRLAHRSH